MSTNSGWIFGVAPLPTDATATGTAETPTVTRSGNPQAEAATATALSYGGADISTNSGWIFGTPAFADHAFGIIGSAFDATSAVSPTAVAATASAAAGDIIYGRFAAIASASAAAQDATVTIGRSSFAQTANATAVSGDVVAGLAIQPATGAGHAYNATISNVPPLVFVYAHAEAAFGHGIIKKAHPRSNRNGAKTRKAIDFIKAQMQPKDQPVTTSTLSLTTSYSGLSSGSHSNAGWLFGVAGQAAGTFTLSGLNSSNTGWRFQGHGSHRATEQLCPITVISPPGALAPAFRGVVTGTVSGLGGSLLYKVQAYRRLDIDYDMHVFGNINADGTFALDLSSVPATPGEWRFAVVLRSTSAGQIGAKWPQPVTYVGLVVERYEITDVATLIESQPAQADNAFTFVVPVLGNRQQVRLVDTAHSNALIAQYTDLTGCVRSFATGYGLSSSDPLADQCYIEDQGFALAAMVAAGERAVATSLADGMLLMQTDGGGDDGGFIYSAAQLSPEYGDAVYRTGAHATALYALMKHILAVRDRVRYRGAAVRALDWLETQLSGSGDFEGLYTGGSGSYSSDIAAITRVNEDLDITGAITADNLSVWQALNLASHVFGEPYTTRAKELEGAILDLLWQPELGRFARSYQLGGLDLADSLELHTRGALWLLAIGQPSLAAQTMSDEQLGPFYKILRGGA